MRIYKKNNKWLSQRTKNKIKENHPDLYKGNRGKIKKNILDFLSRSNSWFVVVLVVPCLFLISLIDIPLLNVFVLKYETARSMVDSRVGDVATVISLSFVIIGFIISGIAKKSSVSYWLIVRKSWMFPIVYSGLSLIGCLFILSLLKDTLVPFHFTQLTIAGVYLSVFMLFLIGLLFRRVLSFADENILYQEIEKELLEEATTNLYISHTKQYSKVIFNQFLEENQCEKFDIHGSVQLLQRTSPSSAEDLFATKKGKPVIIADINLKKIERIIQMTKRNNRRIWYKSFGLYLKTSTIEDVIWNDNGTLLSVKGKQDKRVFKTTDKEIETKWELKNTLVENIEKSVENNELNKLKVYLESMEKLINLSIENEVNLEDRLIEIDEYYNSNGIFHTIRDALKNAIKNGFVEIIQELNKFINQVLNKSISSKSFITYNPYRFISLFNYHFTIKGTEVQSEIKEQVFSNLLDSLRRNVYSVELSFSDKNSLTELKKRKRFFTSIYTCFSNMMYYAIQYGDLQSFERIKEYISKFDIRQSIVYNQNEQNDDEQLKLLQKAPEEELQLVILSVKFWIIRSSFHHLDQSKTTDLLKLYSEIERKTLDFFNLTSCLLKMLESKDNVYWKDWVWQSEKRLDGKAYFLQSDSDWIIEGVFVSVIREDFSLLLSMRLYTNKELETLLYMGNKIKELTDLYSRKYEERSYLFNSLDKAEFISRAKMLLKQFDNIKKLSMIQVNQSLIQEEISDKRIADFKEKVGLGWWQTSFAQRLSFEYDARKLIGNGEKKLKESGQRILFRRGKVMFVDNQELFVSIYGIDDWGRKVGVVETREFFNTIFQSKYQYIKDKDITKCIDECIAQLKNHEVEPDCIIIPRTFQYKVHVSPKYKEKEKLEKNLRNFEIDDNAYLGEYDGIPTFQTTSPALTNSVIVSNFKQAFEVEYKEVKNGYKSLLKVEVNGINDTQEAKEILDEDREGWMHPEENVVLSEEEAFDAIKSSVYIETGCVLDYVVKDIDAFMVGMVEN